MGAEPLPYDGMVVDATAGTQSAGAIPTVTKSQRKEEDRLLRRKFDGAALFLAGPANVVIQLAWPEVGHALVESKVEGGQVFKHPLKRYRTTIGYLAIASFGSDELRTAYRKAVDGQHRQVRSGPDSPVKYNGFNRDLQLWVASSIYYGARDIVTRMHGPLSREEDEMLLRASSRYGTTLQVPEDMWHKDMDAFWDYWNAGLERAQIDETVGSYLRALIEFKFMPKPVRPLARPLTWANVGFLPHQLRDQLDLAWTDRDQRRHDRMLRTIRLLGRPLPESVRLLPLTAMMWNIEARRRLGRPLV